MGSALAVAACSSHGARGPSGATSTEPAAAADLPVQPGDWAGSAQSGEMSTTGCSVPAALPSIDQLPTDAKLPDPFTSIDGTRITRKDQWTCRRAEIMAQAERYELGQKPPKPFPGASPAYAGTVQGSFDPGSSSADGGDAGPSAITVTVTVRGHSTSFVATVTYPPPGVGSPPYPAMIGIDGIELGPSDLLQAGVALVDFPADDVALQNNGGSRGAGKFYDLYGEGSTAGAMMAWAWGVSRLIDVLPQIPEAQIDPTRLGVTGCSRDGKGALVAGAFDERIALTVPQESGSGGAASWRISDWQVANGTTVQTLSEITQENVWFTPSFAQFDHSSTKLPFDHHMIEGLVAPRALLVIENTSQVWLGNVSTYDDSMAANLIWQGLGIPDHMGVSQVGDHTHCVWNGSQEPEVAAYVGKFLVGGGTGDTNVLKTDAAAYCTSTGACTPYTFDQSQWVDWTVPALQ